MVHMYYLKAKSDAYQVIVDFINLVQRQFTTTVLSLLIDNGGEYTKVDIYLKQQGIRHIRTPPYSHRL